MMTADSPAMQEPCHAEYKFLEQWQRTKQVEMTERALGKAEKAS